MVRSRPEAAEPAGRAGRPPPPPRKKHKLASTKNKLRSVQRLLAKVEDPKAKRALEAQRRALLGTQAATAQAAKERKLAVRYHKVKFFGALAVLGHSEPS